MSVTSARTLTWTHPKTGLRKSVLWWLNQKPVPLELMESLGDVIAAWRQVKTGGVGSASE